MKMLTLNTHSWMEEDGQQQLEVLAKRIMKEDYDLIALQEVNQLITSPLANLDKYFQPTEDQQAIHQDNFLFCLTERLKAYDCQYYWGWSYNHIGYDIYHEGIGLLSKTPFAAMDLLVSKSKDPTDYHTRRLMIGETKLGKQRITVVSGHFSWWQGKEKAFAYEWQQLEETLRNNSDGLILMGDFNNDAMISGEGYKLVMNSPLSLQDTFMKAEKRYGEHTVEEAIDGWTNNLAQLRIDYVVVSEHFTIDCYRIVFNGKTDPKISDHYGIEVEMDWR